MKPTSALVSATKILLLLLFLVATATKTNAQGIVKINPVFFHVDSVKNIVLINAPSRQLSTDDSSDSLRIIASSGRQYVLMRAVSSFSPAATYQATSKKKIYQVFFTKIPVLHLNTRYQIADLPSVYAKLVLTDTTGIRTQSATGIEYRGAFSQSYPKKSYELSLRADTLGVVDRDISLLGMRTDNKWNLQAMYNDPLRLRIKVANELWQDMNRLYYQAKEPDAKSGIALAYTEVFINDKYQGIYTLTERIDRKQLKLKKYSKGIMGELYKGISWGEANLFTSAPAFDNTSLTWGGFEYKEPTERIDWTNLHGLVNFVVNSSDADFYSQYQRYFLLENAVDYYIFLNVMRATDNTGKNIYIAKYKPGEPYYYAPWDLDGVLGTDWSGANVDITNDILTNGLYNRLAKDNASGGFRALLASRWANLRTTVLTQNYIASKIALNNQYLLHNNVYEREHLAWPDYHYEAAQLTYPTGWLTSRLSYLNSVFDPSSVTLAAATAAPTAVPELYPNPANGELYVAAVAFPCQLAIQDVSGKTVLQTTLASSAHKVDISSLAKGVYLASIKNARLSVVKKLLVN